MFITFFIYLLIPFCTGSATSSGESAFPTREVGTVIPKVLQAILVDRYGEMHGYNIAKHQLALDLKLPLRDMRLIDPSFPGQTQAAFAARPNALLFTFENIKVIVQKDHALVFGTTQADVVEFVPALQAQLRAVCSTDSRMRFEHTVIETALNVVCTKLLNNVRALSPGINTALQELQAQSKGLDVIQTQVLLVLFLSELTAIIYMVVWEIPAPWSSHTI